MFPRIAFTCALIALSVALPAQTYTRQVLETGLENPRGILLAPNGDLYFTEVPTPGINGASGGQNRVSVRSAATGMITVRETGMPEPLHLAMSAGQVYWVCRTAGVIFQSGFGPVARGLDHPTGLAAAPNGALYFTEVPTPGVPGSQGGRNAISGLSNGQVSVLSTAEPLPNDIVMAPSGDLYWTCTAAGVIVRQNPETGARAVVARGLDRPMGLAVDAAGILYFTEVPTPGLNGRNGGENEVWRFDPSRGALSLISRGEPEPYDIAVSADGSRLYWTCSTAGVIVRADLQAQAPGFSTFGAATPNATLRFFLNAPDHPGALYQVAHSQGLGSVGVGMTRIGLLWDDLLLMSLAQSNTPLFQNHRGTLDGHGMGTAQVALPNDPALIGERFFSAYVILDMSAPDGIATVSETLTFVIQ